MYNADLLNLNINNAKKISVKSEKEGSLLSAAKIARVCCKEKNKFTTIP